MEHLDGGYCSFVAGRPPHANMAGLPFEYPPVLGHLPERPLYGVVTRRGRTCSCGRAVEIRGTGGESYKV